MIFASFFVGVMTHVMLTNTWVQEHAVAWSDERCLAVYEKNADTSTHP